MGESSSWLNVSNEGLGLMWAHGCHVKLKDESASASSLLSGPRKRFCGQFGRRAFNQKRYTSIAMGTDGGPLHRLIPRRTHHPESAQAIRAGQHEITGKAGPRPDGETDYLGEVNMIGRFSSQFIDDMQEVRKSFNILLEPAVGLSLPRKLTGE